MRVEPIGKVYRIILGKPVAMVAPALKGKVTGATLTAAVGFWEGDQEESTVIEIATVALDVVGLANDLASQFGEQCAYVGLPDGTAVLVYPEK